jgi:regulatory protein
LCPALTSAKRERRVRCERASIVYHMREEHEREGVPKEPGIIKVDEKALARARNTAYRLLTYRARSRKELEEKLKDREFGAEIIESVVADLTRLGYVNDREFARQWAAGRVRMRGFGGRRIEQELRNKGISRDVIQQTLSEVFEGAPEADIAQQEAEKKLRSLTRFAPEVRRRRLAGHLERRGFPSETIYAVLRRVGAK